ncbi:hypothetical protein [Victivallis sp. Marseille-Q1083]|nr:hypothetical protein [Victivallis sp. Marseille-Q1083]
MTDVLFSIVFWGRAPAGGSILSGNDFGRKGRANKKIAFFLPLPLALS